MLAPLTSCSGLGSRAFGRSGRILWFWSPRKPSWVRTGQDFGDIGVGVLARRAGRKPVTKEIRELIIRMVSENPTWGAPRIHGELLKLGFDVSERTVSRWMQCGPQKPDAGEQWKAFLDKHREAIAAMDFFTVPTMTFDVLHCFFVIANDRRRILHFHLTIVPDSPWIAQQLREVFPMSADSSI